MNLTIDRRERDSLHVLMSYRFFVGDDRRLQRALEQGASPGQLACEFEEDMWLMGELGWLDQELAEALGMPGADRPEFELTMQVEALANTLMRAREEARVGFADGLKRTPTETEEERRTRFRVAKQTCDELLVRLGNQEEAPA
jgi:hypothetical protein